MNELIEKISARYALDQKDQPKARHRGDIPISYDAITPEWLTEVLCQEQPGAQVTGFSLDAPDDGSSNRRRIFVTYNDAGNRTQLPSSIFCKGAHGLNNRILFAISGCGHAETTFYNTVRPTLDIEAPTSYLAAYDAESGNCMVVLKDMTEVEFCRPHTSIDRNRANSMVDLLATFHGTFYQSSKLTNGSLKFLTWPQFWNNTVQVGMAEFASRGFLAAEEVIPARLYARHPEIMPATMRSVERHKELPQTLTHSDVHLKNWYVAKSGAMGLNDWQNTCVGHWSRDFAYSMSSALTIENRRLWERELLVRYLDRLQQVSGQETSFDQAWLNYRQQLFTALAYWTVTLTPSPSMPDMQPRDTSLEFIRRISHAMDDHDSLGSFD